MKLVEKLPIVAEILDSDALCSSLGEEIGCRAVEDKKMDADVTIVAAQTANTFQALALARGFWRIRNRVIDDA
jgi:hypothetical protein